MLPAGASRELVALAAGATAIAIDAPAAPSTAPHAGDPSLSPKFRPARCCEIAGPPAQVVGAVGHADGRGGRAGMDAGRVPAPRGAGADGHAPIEVYPYAGFRLLAGRVLSKKTTVSGVRERVAVLEAERVAAPWMRLWSHDALDAAMAAMLALRAGEGTAIPVGCGHDGSTIWIPRVG